MTSRKLLLSNLLQALVQEWGRQEVEAALRELSDVTQGIHHRSVVIHRKSRIAPRKSRMSASEQVARAQLLDTQRAPIRELALRFDSKQFLPSVSAVREFLFMMGGRPVGVKDRSDSFRSVLDALSRLPEERLRRLVDSAIHSGPAQLGPLSEAIAAASVSLPRKREPDAS